MDTARPRFPLAYYYLQGLIWVVLGGALLTGMVLYRTGLADLGAVFVGPFGPPAALLAGFGLMWPVRAYYRSRFGFRYPAQSMSKEQFALAMLIGLLLGGVLMIAALVSVLAEPRLSFWGLLVTVLLFLVYWPKRKLAPYWILPVVVVSALILLPFFGIGVSNEPHPVFLPIDQVILVAVGVLLVVLGALDHIRLVRLLGVRRQG